MKLTQTNDISSLLDAVATCQIGKYRVFFSERWVNQLLFVAGEADFMTAIKVAQLSLKHRQNKS